MKQMVFQKASFKGIKLTEKAGFVEMMGRLTPQIAACLNVAWLYDRDQLPRQGGKKHEIEAEFQNCKVTLDVKGVVQFHMSFPSPLIDKFAIVRVGGRKKAKSTWLVVKFRARVMDREEELFHFWKTARNAEGVLTIDAAEQPEQTTIPGTDGKAIQDAAAKAARKAENKAAPKEQPITFAERMRAAKTADEGRDILHDHEQAIHSLMEAHGLVPLCGPSPNGYTGFSVTTPKERKAAIKDLRLKEMGAGDALHDLIAEGEAMQPIFERLHLEELKRHFEKPQADDDAIPGTETETVNV